MTRSLLSTLNYAPWIHVMATVLAVAGAAGCEPEPGRGTVSITTWGEQYIEDGLPSEVFQDGWSVKYSKFLVAFRRVTLSDESEVVELLDNPVVFDLTEKTKGRPKTLATRELEAKLWSNVSYQIGPLTAEPLPGERATPDDAALLRSEGAAIHVEGVAHGPTGDSKAFRWGIPDATVFEDCHGMQDGKALHGVLVTNGGNQTVQLTIHGDHPFYDDIQSAAGAPRFQALANADANSDGDVAMSELDAVPLYAIPRDLGTYGTGALGNVDDLGAYVRTLFRTIGHFRGEGSCNARALPQ